MVQEEEKDSPEHSTNEVSHLETTMVDIQINVMDAIEVDYETPKKYGVVGYEVNNGVTFFQVLLPENIKVFRRMEHFLKFRDFITKKWSGFVPLP